MNWKISRNELAGWTVVAICVMLVSTITSCTTTESPTAPQTTRVITPTAGSVYHVGDTVHIKMFSTEDWPAVIDILIDVEALHVVDRINLSADSTRDTFFVVPASFKTYAYDTLGELITIPVSPIRNDIRLKVYNYNAVNRFFLSEPFTIAAR